MRQTTPVLRIFDVPLALSFYVDYLGCSVDWKDGDPTAGPVYLQVSRGPLVLHLSTHHGDGTPGGVVLVEMRGIRELLGELHSKGYGASGARITNWSHGSCRDLVRLGAWTSRALT